MPDGDMERAVLPRRDLVLVVVDDDLIVLLSVICVM